MNGKKMGFTLIELLIVVAIIAILAAIAVPNFLEAQIRAKVSRVMNDMRTEALALTAYQVDYNVGPIDSGYPPAGGSEVGGSGTGFKWYQADAGATGLYYWPGDTNANGPNPGGWFPRSGGGSAQRLVAWWEMVLTTPTSYISKRVEDPYFHGKSNWIMSNGLKDDSYVQWQGNNVGEWKNGNYFYRNFEHCSKGSDYFYRTMKPTGKGNGYYLGSPSVNWECGWGYVYFIGGYRWALVSAGPSYRGKINQVQAFNYGSYPLLGQPGFPTYDPSNGSKSQGYIVRTDKGVYTIDNKKGYNNDAAVGIP